MSGTEVGAVLLNVRWVRRLGEDGGWSARSLATKHTIAKLARYSGFDQTEYRCALP